MMDTFDDPGTMLDRTPRMGRRGGWCARNCSCCFDGLAWMPVALLALIVAMLAGTYVWAVTNGDVYPIFPYISDTGAEAPERSYFSMCMCLGSALLYAIVLTRYLQINTYYKSEGNKVSRLNRWSYYLGTMSAFGMLLVANFQDNEIFTLHFLGAFMVYGGGTVYAWIHAVLTTRIHSTSLSGSFGVQSGRAGESGVSMGKARFILAGLCTVTMVMVGAFAMLAFNEQPLIKDLPPGCGANHSATDKFDHMRPWPGKWEPCMEGYGYHLVSTLSEWLLTLFFGLYFLTFSWDFAKISLNTEVRLTGSQGHYESVGSPAADIF